jgi:hypothetical protein
LNLEPVNGYNKKTTRGTDPKKWVSSWPQFLNLYKYSIIPVTPGLDRFFPVLLKYQPCYDDWFRSAGEKHPNPAVPELVENLLFISQTY